MLRATLSILGLYQFNNDIFDFFQVPNGLSKDNAIAEILSQCAELELVYPSYDVMKQLIGVWTTSELYQWTRAYEDMTIEYNPIWNVDGTETETIERELSGATTTSSNTTANDNTINSTKGYNSNEWTETDKSTGVASGTASGSGKESITETITTTKTRGGNIGVTMTQQMLTADLDLLTRLNPYQFIVNSFKRRFCLLVY